MSVDLNLGGENPDKCTDLIEKLQETRNNRLRLPLTKLPERYLRSDYAMVFHCLGSGGVPGNRKFALSVECDFLSDLAHRCGEMDQGTRIDNDKLPVLIESIHVVNDEERIIRNIRPSIVRLHLLDPREGLGIGNALYFSVVSLDVLFAQRLGFKQRELDNVLRFEPRFVARKVPNNMVKTRSQVVNNLSGEDSKTYRDRLATVIVDGFLPSLVIWMGEDWILPALKKDTDLGMEVTDVLIGPL